MGDYKINGIPIKELMKTPMFVALSAPMEALFLEIHGKEDAKELMAVYGILTAGLIKFYASHSSKSKNEELEEFVVLVEYCLEAVTIVRESVH